MKTSSLVLVGWLVWAMTAATFATSPLTCLEPDARTGSSRAVIVDDAPLAHTFQAFPLDAAGKLVDADDATKQTEQALANLDKMLRPASANLNTVVKLNVYLAHDTILPEVQSALAKTFSGVTKPAVAFVTGELTLPGAFVAMDAVAVSAVKSNAVVHIPAKSSSPGIDAVSVLPAGPKLYVSGMAEPGALLPATRATLEKLVAAISHLDAQPEDIAQLKVFLQPMSEVAAVRRVITKFFAGRAPPTVFVEWISANPVVEIELIAAAKTSAGKETNSVSYFTPPGTTDSKVYRRVARVNHGRLIYISGLHATQAANGAGQVWEIFDALGGIAKQTGSDFEHLVKATYYLTDTDTSRWLNELRPRYYHPLRPPAASKAMVRGTGQRGRTVTLDMIAATK